MSPVDPPDNRPIAAAVADFAAVLAFVIIGRRSHQESSALADISRTAAPFLLALFGGWLTGRAWIAPFGLRTGATVWAVTLVGGMILRRVAFDDGTATPFVIVTGLFLAACFLGWRVAAGQILRWRSGINVP